MREELNKVHFCQAGLSLAHVTVISNATDTITIMASSQSSVQRSSEVGGVEVVLVGSGQEDLWKSIKAIMESGSFEGPSI